MVHIHTYARTQDSIKITDAIVSEMKWKGTIKSHCSFQRRIYRRKHSVKSGWGRETQGSGQFLRYKWKKKGEKKKKKKDNDEDSAPLTATHWQFLPPFLLPSFEKPPSSTSSPPDSHRRRCRHRESLMLSLTLGPFNSPHRATFSSNPFPD